MVPNLRNVLECSFLPALEPVVVVLVNTEQKHLPLICFTAWDTFREDICQDPKCIHIAYDIKSKHTDNEHDGIFIHLTNAVHYHFKKVITILDDHPHKISLANILRNDLCLNMSYLVELAKYLVFENCQDHALCIRN